jgi:hypothetical protein
MDKTSPSHYQFGSVQLIEITKHLDFLMGNCVKYCARAGKKSGESRLDDLRKAKQYIVWAIEMEEGNGEGV